MTCILAGFFPISFRLGVFCPSARLQRGFSCENKRRDGIRPINRGRGRGRGVLLREGGEKLDGGGLRFEVIRMGAGGGLTEMAEAAAVRMGFFFNLIICRISLRCAV